MQVKKNEIYLKYNLNINNILRSTMSSSICCDFVCILFVISLVMLFRYFCFYLHFKFLWNMYIPNDIVICYICILSLWLFLNLQKSIMLIQKWVSFKVFVSFQAYIVFHYLQKYSRKKLTWVKIICYSR